MKKPRRRLALVLAACVCAAVAAGAFYGLRKRETVITVQTEKAAPRNITELVVANGRIYPVVQVVINPEVSGEIIELPVKEGQAVRKGDLLLKIKPDNYIASRNSAQASFRSAMAGKTLALANVRKAELDLKRAQDLSARSLISAAELLEAETSCAVMKATSETSAHQADQAAATLARAEDDLAKTTICAPMSGVVIKLKSQRGERVVGTAMMAGTEVMTIADLDDMEARVDIGEMDVVLISVGQVARLEVDAFRDRKFAGRVTQIANSSKAWGAVAGAAAASAQSQDATKFEVKIRVEERELFRPGMSVTAEIETRHRTNALAVPIQSVTTRVPKKATQDPGAAPPPSGREAAKKEKPVEVVFIREGERVKMVPVKRGISDDAYVEITEGLAAGAEVVAGGYKAINRELEDGGKVKVGAPDEKTDEAGGR